MKLHFFVVAALTVASALNAGAQESCQLLVGAFDRQRVVRDLSASDFQVRVRGRTVPVTSAAFRQTAPRILVVLDRSGSMGSTESRLSGQSRLIHDATAEIIHRAPPGSPLGLVTFADTVEETAFTQDRTALVAKVAQDVPKGRTALRNAIIRALRLFGSVRSGDSLILITDGGDNRSGLSERIVRDQLRASGVRVFALVTSDGQYRTEEERLGPVFVNELVNETGGLAMALDVRIAVGRPDKISAELQSIAETLYSAVSQAYELNLAVPPSPKPEKLEVKVPGRKHLVVIYPDHIAPCN